MSRTGSVCIIANPVAQSGACAAIAKRIAQSMRSRIGDDSCRLVFTEFAGHAEQIAESAGRSFDTLVLVGGDGVVHEAANGLMRIPSERRCRLGVIPVGSGNDYALTLGMSGNPDKALEQILDCQRSLVDVGQVNGRFFVETLSFGVDAAIAIGTMDARKLSKRKGTLLYLESGIDQIVNHLDARSFDLRMSAPEGIGAFEDASVLPKAYRHDGLSSGMICRHVKGESLLFAIQIGKTYGGHFDVCPKADPTDGLFDICIAYPPLTSAKALAVFLLARFGLHTSSRIFEFAKASSLTVAFDEAPPCQVDGEPLEGTVFEVSMLPRSLEVIVGSDRKWS